ncbi:MAG TPA: LLM class flavin-dependent oxidoreductase [Acidimicrobiales bacterium]|nr:LLM class flavin-dependent oxidoreductase [Acidimicrobiales bacterium]
MDRPLALSVLDQAPAPAGTTPDAALREVVELARAAEAWRYRRYWIAEHHNTPSLAATAPEVAVAAVAAATSSIRVGSGGVLLPYYSPLKVAEVFRSLDALFPGRIDLGIGRAAGTDPAAEAALLASGGASGEERFAENLVELLSFLEEDAVAAAAADEVRAMPSGGGGPEVWLLGSSSYSSACAAYLGLPLAFAHFITPAHGPQIVESYRRGFRGGAGAAPRALIAVGALCAESDEEAERQAGTADLWRLGPEGAPRRPILPPEEVAAHQWTDLQRERASQARAGVIAGSPERVRARLVSLAEEFAVDEVMVVTVCHDLAARRRSYELLAEAFGLRPPQPIG